MKTQHLSPAHASTLLKGAPIAIAIAAAAIGAAMPLLARAADYANVVSSTPVTASVAVPRQDCVDGEQFVQRQPSGAGALIGAIAGGVLGNQFGHGFGRAAATGLGVVTGSAIGNNVEAGANPPEAVPVRHCRTVSTYENRIVGYDVVYEYHGQRYTTRLANDPGPRLAIDVRPAGAPVDNVASDDAPAPPYGAPAPVYSAPPAYYASPGYAPYYGPSYYGGPAVVVRPAVTFGYWGGWHHGYRHW